MKLSTAERIGAFATLIFIAILPLLIVLIANLHQKKLSAIQHFRETHKRFFQFAAAVLLILLGIYLIVFKIEGGN